MIENLLKRNKTKIFIGFIFSVLIFSCRNSQNRTKIANNSSGNFKQKNLKKDTIFFRKKNDSILDVVNKKDAHFFRIIIDSSLLGHRFFDYSTYEFTPNIYEPIETGNIQNIYELNPQKAIANGKWIMFGNDTHPANPKYHIIGYYKQGVKDSIWYTSYEDGWDEYFYYKNGTPIDYVGNVSFYGHQESLVVEGSKFRKDGLPIGIWKYLSDDKILEHEYIHQKDSILVKYISYDKQTNKVIDKGAFIAAKYDDELEYREIKE